MTRRLPTLPSLLFALGGLAALLAVLFLPAPPVAAQPTTESFTFTPCNRTFEGLGGDLAPVRQGNLTVELTSPRNRLQLFDHRLELTPLADGSHRARFVADFAGSGDLVADVDVGGMGSQLRDQVVLPRQESVVDGRVRLGKGDQGYEVTPLELPESVDLVIQSQLAGRFAAVCDSLSLVPGMILDCDGVRAGLSRARVPMPEIGETYVLPAECLDGDTRLQLDLYLDRWGR